MEGWHPASSELTRGGVLYLSVMALEGTVLVRLLNLGLFTALKSRYN